MKRPRFRKMTWALVLWSLLMGIWIVSAIASTGDATTDCGTLSQKACNDAANVGTGIGVVLLVLLWAFGFGIGSILWFMSRPTGQASQADQRGTERPPAA